jgi:hypothetical protein
MLTPFETHTLGMSQLQSVYGGGDRLGLATLDFGFNPKVPCAHTQLIKDFELVPGGRSVTSFIERCEFKAVDIGSFTVGKDVLVSITLKPGQKPYAMRIWSGGLMEGGEIYRFMLVAANWKA